MNDNYIMLDGKKIMLSDETAENFSKQLDKSKVTQLRPYFGKVKSGGFGKFSVDEWDGHFGLTEDGRIALCNPHGKRIVGGTLLIVTGLTFYRVLYINPKLGLPIDQDGILTIK